MPDWYTQPGKHLPHHVLSSASFLSPEDHSFITELASRVEGTTMEIGTWLGGGSTRIFAQRARETNGLHLCIDHFGRPEFATYNIPNMQLAYEHLKVDGLHMYVALIPGDSRRLLPIIGEESISAIFIDGEHSPDGAERDIKLAEKVVEPGGLIIFHDIENPNYQPYSDFVQGRMATHRYMGRGGNTAAWLQHN